MGRVITLSNYKKYIITNFIEIDGISPTLETIYNELKLYYQKRDEYRTEAPTLALKIENDFNIGKTTQRIIEVYSTVS